MIERPKVKKSVANVNGINMEQNQHKKQKAINATVRHLIDDAKDITDVKKINACICKFYKNIFRKNVSKSDLERESLLNSIGLPNLNSKFVDICESDSKVCSMVNPLVMMV